ncbi:RNA polymerase sigma-70 factor [Coprobacter secundus]|uniref:RNA polymerase sigma-70 factor n=1 Tax=Coprobacter secundus TaxID=1501392 RepID=UPI00387EDD1E
MEFERKIIEHDMIAFQELYNNNISELVAFAYRFTYDIEIAKDLVHDAFVWIWDHPEKINCQGNIEALLLHIVRSNCLNYIRDLDIQDKNQEKLVEASIFAGMDIDDDPYGQKDELIKRLKKIMGSLPEKSRIILEKHIINGTKVKDIASEMHIAESTVKTHLKRTMRVLRENMAIFLFTSILFIYFFS